MNIIPVKRALISVSDKSNLVSFVKQLVDLGVTEILSTGGTAKILKENGLNVIDIADYTGWPEMMDGRVKTLHPKIFGGILARRDIPEDLENAEKHNIKLIDLVVVNLYPFEDTIEKENVTEAEAVEQIDIGGPSLLRAAAKNFNFVTTVCNPKYYDEVIDELKKHQGINIEMRRKLAADVFEHTHRYDFIITDYLREQANRGELLDLHYVKVATLRYGENPHQGAAFFRNPNNRGANITNAKVLNGKQLSFNNILDGDAAIELVREFEKPSAAIIKHTNPCGFASAETIEQAFKLAYEVDPMSAFGCVIALNRPCTLPIVDYINQNKLFIEIIAAPSFAKEALKELQKKQNLRLLELSKLDNIKKRRDIKKVVGGILIQNANVYIATKKDIKVVTKNSPTEEQIKDMLFAQNVAKHVKSNAIVLAKDEVTTGIGAGQMSRVDAIFMACHKAGTKAKGSILASDGFFPFADSVEEAAKAGVTAIIQPGGSIRDEEVIKKADELGLPMVFTGVRNFRH